ncbi:hypothetical protein LTS18_014323 [Coniosporium uncinatum]|uniref:Uncharacterized protein n=1 Tax=Coniosporium uncinatum TaxID=93489 RepID=A0ACC3DH01_9PEZI|nr:hypothetical protein LTS18_014323 [Coniosporium uncinatum]
MRLCDHRYVFAKFQISLENNSHNPTNPENSGPSATRDHGTRSIPTYLSLLIFGFIYELALVYDALRLQNTIQVIGLCLYNLGILVYTAIQIDQIQDAVNSLGRLTRIDDAFWDDVRPFLIAVPCVVALATAIMGFVAWKLYDEFAWTIYKQISADLRMKRRFLIYQIYIALLKFDFFFFLGFTVQFLVIVSNTTTLEFYLTIAAMPLTILILLLAALFTRKESTLGMLSIIALYFAALAYFLFKLVRMYNAGEERVQDYLPARRMLTTFAVLTILLLVVTIVVAGWCTRNFGHGLRQYVDVGSKRGGSRGRGGDEVEENDKLYMQDVVMKPVGVAGLGGSSRMVID